MTAKSTRTELDTFGPIEVPDDRLWGAQTQRSLQNFDISGERMPAQLLRALAIVKKAAALVNMDLGAVDARLGNAIVAAADEVIAGKHEQEFPLVVWQTGSGTQSNMNMNEVLANRASEILGGVRGEKRLVHPNDHVNRGQSSNDVFPAAMSLACVDAVRTRVLPSVKALRDTLAEKSTAFKDIVKIGRTHLMERDAAYLGPRDQRLGGATRSWAKTPGKCGATPGRARPGRNRSRHRAERSSGIRSARRGQGSRAHLTPDRDRAEQVRITGRARRNRVRTRRAEDARSVTDEDRQRRALAGLRPALRFRRDLDPGERTRQLDHAGQGQPNSVRSDDHALRVQIFGNDVAVNFGGASGNFELNVYKPLLAHNFLQSARLIADGCDSFRKNCAVGIEPNRKRIQEHLENSLMLVTALNPHIGYDNAAKIAKKAHKEGLTLRQSAEALGLVSSEDFSRFVRPEEMLGPKG